MDNVEQLLKDLTEAHGVSGAEQEIRTVISQHLSVGNLSTDKLGSLICDLGGDGPRVMLMAHMDEIGFMVRHITKDGFIKFVPVGGWLDQVLLAQRVIVKTRSGDRLGVIGARAPHLTPADERNKMIKKDKMYIDIGCSSRDEVEALGVQVGDFIVPVSQFDVLANGKTYMSKALDDRVGCAVMVEALKRLAREELNTHVYGVASVLEEVGTRGAVTATNMVRPHLAFILEAGLAGDVPNVGEDESTEKLGGGPVIGLMDYHMLYHNKLRDFVLKVADDLGMDTQVEFMPRGATDGAKVHIYGEGVPTLTLAVTTRYFHSHNAIMHRDDFDQTVRLLVEVIKRLDAETVERVTSFDIP
jgi:putative aminopeptidase FrvX